jgi:CRISPR-associated endonuclease Csn1
MKDVQNAPYTLGLDIGNASVGAALLGEKRIVALHVRTFDRAETNDKGESLNKIRRESRSVRRRLRRRAYRKQRLCQLFVQQGLITDPVPDSFAGAVSPWLLRADGLDRLLTKQEWAAVLYHIVKHRGFQSTRKSEVRESEKAGQMLYGVKQNQILRDDKGYRTVGEMAVRDDRFAQAKRNKGGAYNHTFSRADLEHELSELFEAQRHFCHAHAGKAFEAEVHRWLMVRRPALSGNDLLRMVGKCTFEQGEYRAPKACYTAQRFVWVTTILNNLRINRQGTIRSLTEEERRLVIDAPFQKTKTKLTYKLLRQLLELDKQDRFVGLHYATGSEKKDPESTALFEAKEFHTLRKAYEKAGLKLEWARDSQNPQRLDDLGYALSVFKEDDEARTWLGNRGIEPEIIEVVLAETFSAFLHLSLKTLHNILPHMEAGLRYDEAVIKAGYRHHSQINEKRRSSYIPRPSREQFSNPVVFRALNQARKLVNAIVRAYGPPSAVHIELARDLSRPLEERRKTEKAQGEYRKNKEADITYFEEEFGFTPKGRDLEKWRLYREQDAKCAYSLKPIDINRLMKDRSYTEVDHALPYSRSFDNSMSNKALVLTSENRNKGNQTPYEYLDGKNDTLAWRNFEAYVKANRKYRQAKRDRLLRKNFGKEEAGGFRERHLTDTRYICKEFKRMIDQHLYLSDDAPSNCVVVSGQLTGYLRARWGLLKVRANGDLHHALDAAVVAACTHSMVKRLSDYSRRNELAFARGDYINHDTGEVIDLETMRQLESHFPEPWPLFRRELEACLSPDPATELSKLQDYDPILAQKAQPVRVSRAPTRRGLGAAHQETIRSAKYLEQGKSAVKTPLENLKLKDLSNIVGFDDPRNRELIIVIKQRLTEHGNDGKKAFKEPLYKPSAPGKEPPRIRSVRLLTTQKSGLPIRGGIANNGDMVRADIFTNGKRFYAVPLYVADAVRTELPSRAIVAFKQVEEWTLMDESYRFLFSLFPNDWISIKVKPNESVKEGYYAGLDRSTGAISIWAHDRNQQVGKNGLMRSIGIKTAMSLEKYHVDYLGRLHRVYKEMRQPLKPKG